MPYRRWDFSPQYQPPPVDFGATIFSIRHVIMKRYYIAIRNRKFILMILRILKPSLIFGLRSYHAADNGFNRRWSVYAIWRWQVRPIHWLVSYAPSLRSTQENEHALILHYYAERIDDYCIIVKHYCHVLATKSRTITGKILSNFAHYRILKFDDLFTIKCAGFHREHLCTLIYRYFSTIFSFTRLCLLLILQ